MEKNSVLESLKELGSDDHLEISCLVKTNGDVSASVGKVDPLELETFGIMSATIFGAAHTANDQLKKEEPEQIMIESTDGDTIITNLKNDQLLVVRTKSKDDLDKIKEKIEIYGNKIKDHIE